MQKIYPFLPFKINWQHIMEDIQVIVSMSVDTTVESAEIKRK
jgi:hypothetical protein